MDSDLTFETKLNRKEIIVMLEKAYWGILNLIIMTVLVEEAHFLS